MENAERMHGIDLMKFFMAFAVISIHTSLTSEINEGIAYACLVIIQKAAVPFFFICNGYFSSRSKKKTIQAIWIRFAKMYVLWSVIYLPLEIRSGIIGGGYSLLGYYKDFLLKGYHSYSWHLWYLLGLVYGFMLLSLCKKFKFSNFAVHLLVSVMYIIGRVLTYCALSYSGNNMYIMQVGAIVHSYLYSVRLLCVPLYLIIGNDIANYDKEEQKLHDSMLIVFMIGSLILDTLYLDNEISYVIMPILIFTLSKRANLSQCVLWKYLGRLSYWMYFWHMYIVFASEEVLKLSVIGKQYFVPLISLILATIIIIAENKRIRN